MNAISRLLDSLRLRLGGSRPDHAAIFSEIFQRNAWGSAESISGPGSTRERGAAFSRELAGLLGELEVRVLLDAPCGDFNWIGEVAARVERYIGVDVVPELIARNQERYGDGGRSFLLADISLDPLPAADVLLCRDCLVHFSYHDIWAALANFRRSGTRYLLATTFVGRETNTEIRTGAWRPLNLQARPFRFPAPLRVVDERCLHSGGIYQDKRLALWEMASLPHGP